MAIFTLIIKARTNNIAKIISELLLFPRLKCYFIITQGLIPSLTTAYGIFLLHLKLEHSSFSYPMLWDETMVHTPLLFAATWTIVGKHIIGFTLLL